MTTITATGATTADAEGPTSTTRIRNVVRLHLTNSWNIIVLPWIILAGLFLANFTIWVIILQAAGPGSNGDPLEGTQYTGSTLYIFAYMMVVAIQAINLTFPFALGYSVTRRDYYLGTALTWVILSAMLTAGFTVLSYIEEWTNGWGVGGHFFTAIYFGNGDVFTRILTLLATFLFFFFVGTAAGTIYLRWKVNGMIVAGAAAALIVIGALALIGLTQSWKAVGDWFAAVGPSGVMLWSLVITVVAGIAGFFILRRATPKG